MVEERGAGSTQSTRAHGTSKPNLLVAMIAAPRAPTTPVHIWHASCIPKKIALWKIGNMDKEMIKYRDRRSIIGHTGVMPIPVAITIILSKLVAVLKGDRNGPYTHPGRELGVLRMACSSLVQLPAVAMHTDE